jgi:predicted PurR-regulated permease PerM
MPFPQISKAVTDKELKIPFYARSAIFLVGLFTLLAMLYIARVIIVPIVFSVIIAILLSPVVNFFVRRKINRVLGIVITLFLTFLIIGGFGAFVFSQVSRFSESSPILVDKFSLILNQSITWASGYFDIDVQDIHAWILKTKGELINTSGVAIGQTLVMLGNGVMVLLLVPLYVFLILFYQPLLLDFIRRIFAGIHQNKVSEIVTQTKTVVQRYLFGLVIEFVLVALLNSTALLILGIDYAILLGIIGALLNLIP